MPMRGIHLTNAKMRDAEVAFVRQTLVREIRTVLPDGKEKQNVRVLKSTVEQDEESLVRKFGSWEKVAQALIDDDPEIDRERTGKKLNRTHRIWVDKDDKIAYKINLSRIRFNPDGTEKEKQDINKLPSNVNKEFPLKWTGRFFARKDIVRQFVFSASYQLHHINGATFDFLYAMAKELAEKDSLVLMGGGKKGNEPILLSRGGKPYRGFLEGRIQQERYLLILHLSEIELKGINGEE